LKKNWRSNRKKEAFKNVNEFITQCT